MNVIVEKPKAFNSLKPIIIVFAIAGAVILWTRFSPRPSSPLAFEILGFEGDAQIYDLQSRSWRAPKRGEEFLGSQELRTGADGIVNFQVEDEIRMRLKENSSLKNEVCRKIGAQDVYKLRLSSGILLGATTRQFERKQKANGAVLEVVTRDYVAKIHGAIFRVQAEGTINKVGVLRGFVEVAKPGIFFRREGIRIRGLEETGAVEGVIQPADKVTPEAWGLMKEAYELLEKSAVMEAEQIDLSRNAGSFFNFVFDHGTFFTPKVGYANREFFKDPDTGQILLETEYDVFPMQSFAGVYIKTRDFDISKFAGISFEVRRDPEEGAPDSFFIEVKSKGNVVRRFAPKSFERNWNLVEFDFHAKKPTNVNEVVFVFTNTRAGESKKGVLQFRNFNLIPLPPAPPVAPKVETATMTETPAQVTAPAATAVNASAPAPATPAPLPKPVPFESDLNATTASVPAEVPLQ